jgi:hypothetical protein
MSAHPRPSSMRYLARVLMDSGMSGEDRELTQRQSLPVWRCGSIGWSGDMKVEVEVEIMLNLVGMKKDSQDAVRGKMILKDMKLVWYLPGGFIILLVYRPSETSLQQMLQIAGEDAVFLTPCHEAGIVRFLILKRH